MEITLQTAKSTSKAARNAKDYFRDAAQPEDVFITCAFTMVSLDPVTKRPPSNIAPLVLSTPAERTLYAKGEENHKAKEGVDRIQHHAKGSRRGGIGSYTQRCGL